MAEEAFCHPKQNGQRTPRQGQAHDALDGASRIGASVGRELRPKGRSLARGSNLTSDTGHRGSLVEGRACTILFHAETSGSRPSRDGNPLCGCLHGQSRTQGRSFLAKNGDLRLWVTACPSPACVIVRWQRDRVQDHSRRKAQREGGFVWKRSQSPLLSVYGQSDGSPLRTKSAFGSARAPLARRDVHGNPRISPASENQRLCAKCLHSSWEESVIRQLPKKARRSPSNLWGDEDAARCELQLASISTPSWATTG